MTVRETPTGRWAAIGWLTLVLVMTAMAAWEWKIRSLGLHPGDLDDSVSHWAVERRKLVTGAHDNVVIFGSSRILFDTDLDSWQAMTGRRPIQLALPGTNPRSFLVRFAEEATEFKGLVIVGVTPELYFSPLVSVFPEYQTLQDYWQDESPSKRSGHWLGLWLSERFAFLDNEYTLGKLIERVKMPEREGVRGPYYGVWKLSESFAGRQTRMWPRLETDPWLQAHAKKVWRGFDRGPLPAPLVALAIEESRVAVAKIRARGGEVMFIRSPSEGEYYARELRNTPRASTWDALLRETGAFGIHFDDHPEMQGLELPEWSHLSRESAERFTRAYVRVLGERYVWLRPGAVAEPGT